MKHVSEVKWSTQILTLAHDHWSIYMSWNWEVIESTLSRQINKLRSGMNKRENKLREKKIQYDISAGKNHPFI